MMACAPLSLDRTSSVTSDFFSPFSQAFLGEARNDNGVKGLLGARNGDAQRSIVPLQLHCVDYRA